jgi:hypothetical protein
METMRETARANLARFGDTYDQRGESAHNPVPTKQAFGILTAVAKIAAADISRNICTVLIEHDGENGIVLTATDSYRLLSVSVPGVAGETFDPVAVYARELAAACRTAKGCAGFSLERSGDSVYLAASNSGSLIAVPVSVGKFPDYRHLFDSAAQAERATAPASFDAALFGGLLDSVATIAGYADRPKDAPLPAFSLDSVSVLKPALLSGSAANGVTFRGLLMPRRV